MTGRCARPGCTETVLPWLSDRFCSVRCEALTVAPTRARSDVYAWSTSTGQRLDSGAHAVITGVLR